MQCITFQLEKYVVKREKGVIFVVTRFESLYIISNKKDFRRKGVPHTNSPAKEWILSVMSWEGGKRE